MSPKDSCVIQHGPGLVAGFASQSIEHRVTLKLAELLSLLLQIRPGLSSRRFPCTLPSVQSPFLSASATGPCGNALLVANPSIAFLPVLPCVYPYQPRLTPIATDSPGLLPSQCTPNDIDAPIITRVRKTDNEPMDPSWFSSAPLF